MKKRNSFVYLLLAGVCLLVMAAAIAFIIKYYADNRREEAVYESLQSAAAGLPTSPLGPQAEAEPSPAPQAFGPASDPQISSAHMASPSPGPDIPDDEALLRTVDFTALQEETNAHIYAWISIPGTRIDYPMLQHPSDNTHYLNHNLDGSRGYPGCIYTEKENAADFSDFNTVIYGHNMKNGSMFHDLHNYEDETFLPEHPYVYIYTPDRVLRYRIFASYRYDDRHLLYSFDYAAEEGRSGYLKEIRGIRSMSAVLDDQVEVTAQDRLVTLSTCVSGRAENRYLVQAVLVDDIPVSDINDLLIYTTMGQ